MLIKNGLAAGENGTFAGDIRVKGEIITEIGTSLVQREYEQVIDAGGMIVMPGGVDVHTHMDLDLDNVRSTDDFYTGTVAAACGGTTTIIDHMAFGPRGCSIRRQAEVYHLLAEGKAVVDYGFHGVFDHVDSDILKEIEELAREGITSHKIYLTYDGKISDAEALRLMESTSGLGVLIAIHAENDGAIAYLREKFTAQGKRAPVWHARSRPPESEAEAVGRMVMLASIAGDAPIYFVHLSSALGLMVLRAARAEGQKNLYAETCPQYLLLDDSMYGREDGLKYIMSPPLRTARDRESLWNGIRGGDVDVIGTDHCPFFYGREKQLGKDDFKLAPGGIPGVEARMPLMFSRYASGDVSLGTFVTLCCAEPARLFGIYPKKGVIAEGSDADLVLIDPEIKTNLMFDMLHENSDYTPYEGLPLNGYPVMTVSRGEIIVEGGEFIGRKGRGKYLKRGLPDLCKRA